MLKILKGKGIKEFIQERERGELQDPLLNQQVQEIIHSVKEKGFQAVQDYTFRFDGYGLKEEDLLVREEEFQRSQHLVGEDFKEAISRIQMRIRSFHEKSRPQSIIHHQREGELLGTLINPLERVGIYIPGGRNPYPSTLLMSIIPAQVAGVKEILLATPGGRNKEINPHLLYTAKELGVKEILRVGGAQAIAAMAYGLKGIKPVKKIVGPGNIYVTLAKKNLYGTVGVDMLAGPSEIVIIADESAPPSFVAADLMAQAEHDPMGVPLLITTHQPLIIQVNNQLNTHVPKEPRFEIITESIKGRGRALLIKTIEEGLQLVNRLAPEHLVLMVKGANQYLSLIKNAGAIFLGPYTPQASGDYLAGPSHVIPTGGCCHFSSPLGVEDFVKRSSLISFSQTKIRELIDDGALLAGLEGLSAHQLSLTLRKGGYPWP